eukprot:TRINITY_DN25385_c0_g1_i2.p1 TRINITY_DN25385_c0_g1~~TRINITY_DN25385_c0_g1_i2.p1  ORF type:complete len:452 (+),score=109.72 TRINITY_DN25385_c0_g1_i2:66-1358(+)
MAAGEQPHPDAAQSALLPELVLTPPPPTTAQLPQPRRPLAAARSPADQPSAATAAVAAAAPTTPGTARVSRAAGGADLRTSARQLIRVWSRRGDGGAEVMRPSDFAGGLSALGLAPAPLDAESVLVEWSVLDPSGAGHVTEDAGEAWAKAFPTTVGVAAAALRRRLLPAERAAVAQEVALARTRGDDSSVGDSTCVAEDDVRLHAFATVIWQQRRYIEELQRQSTDRDAPTSPAGGDPVLTDALRLVGASPDRWSSPTPPPFSASASEAAEPQNVNGGGTPTSLPPACWCWLQGAAAERGRRGGPLFRRRRVSVSKDGSSVVLAAKTLKGPQELQRLHVHRLHYVRTVRPLPDEPLGRLSDAWAVLHIADHGSSHLLVAERGAAEEWVRWAGALPQLPINAPQVSTADIHVTGAAPSPVPSPAPRRAHRP